MAHTIEHEIFCISISGIHMQIRGSTLWRRHTWRCNFKLFVVVVVVFVSGYSEPDILVIQAIAEYWEANLAASSKLSQ